jgi:hypothetical protein
MGVMMWAAFVAPSWSRYTSKCDRVLSNNYLSQFRGKNINRCLAIIPPLYLLHIFFLSLTDLSLSFSFLNIFSVHFIFYSFSCSSSFIPLLFSSFLSFYYSSSGLYIPSISYPSCSLASSSLLPLTFLHFYYSYCFPIFN